MFTVQAAYVNAPLADAAHPADLRAGLTGNALASALRGRMTLLIAK